MGLGISTKCLAVSVTQVFLHDACTYIHTIHNALAETVCCCIPRNTVFTTFHCDVGRQDVEIIHVSRFVFHSVFLCQLQAHIHMPLRMYWPRLFFGVCKK